MCIHPSWSYTGRNRGNPHKYEFVRKINYISIRYSRFSKLTISVLELYNVENSRKYKIFLGNLIWQKKYEEPTKFVHYIICKFWGMEINCTQLFLV